jgi:predicted nucleotidyltransferase
MVKQDQQKIIAVITKYLPQAKVYLFGSRARKDNTPQSDIDIAIDNKTKIDSSVLSNIREEVEESTIPFTIDIVDLNNISKELRDQILKDKIQWTS